MSSDFKVNHSLSPLLSVSFSQAPLLFPSHLRGIRLSAGAQFEDVIGGTTHESAPTFLFFFFFLNSLPSNSSDVNEQFY